MMSAEDNRMGVEEEIRKAEDSIDAAKAALLASGFTTEQIEQLGRFVMSSIALIQYGIMKADKDIKSESAFQPGSFQTKVVR
jgi:hypothetical protein